MKRIFTFILCAVACLSVFAQQDFNRVIVRDKLGYGHPYVIDRVDSLFFANVEGRAAADVEIQEVVLADDEHENDMVKLSVTKTPECQYYKITCVKKSVADAMAFQTELQLERYLDQQGAQTFWDNFTSAEMTGFGFDFQPNTEYFIFTLGYDKYGTAADMVKASFTTPDKALVGTPVVDYSVDEVNADNFTITFIPNDDCGGYAACSFDAGTAEDQFAMFGAWMGFATMGEMIKAWGITAGPGEEITHTWTGMNPDTAYEIYVQPWDQDGTFGPMIIIPITTAKKGGEGVAETTLEVKEFGGDAEYGFYQHVTYTSNDQTSVSRNFIITEEGWNNYGGAAGVEEFAKSDDMASFDVVKTVDEAYWNADPNTTYYAVAIARNINDEWGPMASQKFTTPNEAGDVVLGAKKQNVPSRIVKDEKGRIPASLLKKLQPKKLQLKASK